MVIKYNDMVNAFSEVVEETHISEDVIKSALCEAIAKAYKKDIGMDDIDVSAEINPITETIDIFQNYDVCEEENVEDDELQVSLEDARQLDPSAELGGKVRRKVELEGMSRPAILVAKNVMRQKIREAEKSAVYEEYKDKIDEMVLGVVESIKGGSALINLGKTIALMPYSYAIPGEKLAEGQQIRVVITEVNKDSKGSQVSVSRATPVLVKRLFEKEVPEIFQGIVEIKAIARDPGERTKMAVISHDPSIDPIGSCIGQRGSRVQEISEELHSEKIDIFLWNEDVTELVKNALAPAQINEVLPKGDGSDLLVLVNEDQLSLAIGKRGKNAKLAVKLTNCKIDIKTRADCAEKGIDVAALEEQAKERKEAMEAEAKRKEALKQEALNKAAEQKRQEAIAKLQQKSAENAPAEEEDGFIPEEMQETVSEKIMADMAAEAVIEKPAPAPVEEPVEVSSTGEEETQVEAEIEEESAESSEEDMVKNNQEKSSSRKHADLEELASRNTYVSRFEKLAEAPKPHQQVAKKKKRKTDDDDIKVSNKDLRKQLQDKLNNQVNQPLYTEEELAEIQKQEEEEQEREFDIDYDEYEEYYDDDEDK